MNGSDAIRTAMCCIFDRIIDALRQLTYSSEPDIDFVDCLCMALRLNRAEIWNKVVEEIPEPKGWARLQSDGSTATPAKKKPMKSSTALAGEPESSEEELPATRYKYQEYEIFVSPGLGGEQYGTFRVSDGGSGVKRIVSKKMPMVADRNEAQRNLDRFADASGLDKIVGEE